MLALVDVATHANRQLMVQVSRSGRGKLGSYQSRTFVVSRVPTMRVLIEACRFAAIKTTIHVGEQSPASKEGEVFIRYPHLYY